MKIKIHASLLERCIHHSIRYELNRDIHYSYFYIRDNMIISSGKSNYSFRWDLDTNKISIFFGGRRTLFGKDKYRHTIGSFIL